MNRTKSTRRTDKGERPQHIGFATTAVLLVVAFLAGGAYLVLGRGPIVPPTPNGVVTFSITERDHLEGAIRYPQTPPVGGNHAPVWQNCGYYAAPIPSEPAVHSLEHGAVWVTYRPDLPSTQVETLRRLASHQTFVLVSPFEGLPAPVVTSAWGVQLSLDSVEDSRLQQFVRRYRQGDQTPEPGAPCSSGIGAPS